MTKQKRARHRSATPPSSSSHSRCHCAIHSTRPGKTSPKTLHTLISYQAAARYRAPAHLRYPPPVKAIAHGARSHLGWTESSRPSDWKHRCQAEVCSSPSRLSSAAALLLPLLLPPLRRRVAALTAMFPSRLPSSLLTLSSPHLPQHPASSHTFCLLIHLQQ